MSTTYSGPFDRKVELIDKIADILTDTDEITTPTGNRLCDALQRIADYLEAEAEASSSDSSSGGGSENNDFTIYYSVAHQVCSKTFAELLEAFEAGKNAVAIIDLSSTQSSAIEQIILHDVRFTGNAGVITGFTFVGSDASTTSAGSVHVLNISNGASVVYKKYAFTATDAT